VERAASIDARVAQMHEQADQARASRMIEELKVEVDDALAEYDTPERRDRIQASLQTSGADPEAIEARMLDDVSNALPPSAAPGRRRHPKARKALPRQDISRHLEQGR
jgi:hypothetical protein